MFNWLKNNNKNDDLTLEQQIKKLNSRVTILEGETLALATSLDIVRNKVLKKIQFKKEEIEEKEDEKPKDIYNGMFLPDK